MAYFEHLSDVFDFGKFKDCELGEALMCSPSYVRWVIKNVDGTQCAFADSVIEEVQAIFPEFLKSKELLELIKERREEYYCDNPCWEDEYEGDNRSWEHEETDTYEKYTGSYAQDEIGYSDDEIDTLFDGDPLAYWNID